MKIAAMEKTQCREQPIRDRETLPVCLPIFQLHMAALNCIRKKNSADSRIHSARVHRRGARNQAWRFRHEAVKPNWESGILGTRDNFGKQVGYHRLSDAKKHHNIPERDNTADKVVSDMEMADVAKLRRVSPDV